MDMYSTSCERRQCSDEEFHRAGQERALEEVAALYELIHKMPDGPKKAHFLKRVSGSGRMQNSPVAKRPPCGVSQIEAGSKIPGTPPAFVRSQKFKVACLLS